MPNIKQQFCPYGHDTHVTGRYDCGGCKKCSTRKRHKRNPDMIPGAKGRVTDPTKDKRVKVICKRGHDTSVVGRTKSGACSQCAKEKKITLDKRREYNLRQMYGLSVEQYDQMVKGQNGNCAVCETHPHRLYVDHCHTTGQVRGLLCRTCNFALGLMYDDPKRLTKLLEYANLHKGTGSIPSV